MDKKNIRNFSIIAHIDHGKSTLADRIIEATHSISERDMKPQILDSMDLERERGITIKLNAIQLKYLDPVSKIEYMLNLIDTPGHVDFAYEVSRSLAASEGALLIVDATQGVQPQTIANTYLALENNLKIIPIINKIDMEAANVERTKQEIEAVLGLETNDIPLISAKKGLGIDEVFQQIIKNIPAPLTADDNQPLQALIFDSYFDKYKGIVIFVRVVQGKLSKNQKIRFIQHNDNAEILELGVNTPKAIEKNELIAGEVGWIISNIKELNKIEIGDTITNFDNSHPIPLPGYRKLKPMVFSGFYPVDTEKFQIMEDALKKISLSDSSLIYEKETSKALGFGFRIGFLGLLHMEIIKERIEREFNIDVIMTSPSVIYKITKTNGEILMIQNPADFPKKELIATIEEPYVKVSIFSPQEYIGKLMEYVYTKRGIYISMEIINERINSLIYHLPLGEIVFGFFNDIKSISKGYASFDYEQIDYQLGNLVKVDILIAKEKVDALSIIVSKESAYHQSRDLCERLKEIIPRQNFEIAIQAIIGNNVIARETVKAYRKDVTGYLYGGDVSRKKKLLQKQKKGKKKMKQIGKVNLPPETFVAILKK